MKTKYIYISIGIILITLFIWIGNTGSKDSNKQPVITSVREGTFNVTVESSGELLAKNSEGIYGPGLLRSVGIWQIKITTLVPEGTRVQKGDLVATLDKTEIMSKIKETQSDILMKESKFLQTKLDTTLELRNARDEIVNQEFLMQEKKIIVEQSIYEPPALQRQAQLDYEKTERTLNQSKENYKIKRKQAVAKMQEAEASLESAKYKFESMDKLLSQTEITAPKDGMVIYVREWDGKKKTVGSTIGPWEPKVATLPDLSVMISKTYINEVDISQLRSGQQVIVGLDASPEKKLTGKVINVANVGEQRPGGDSKVFEVDILINESDTTLRPAMTTSNSIIISESESVLSVPLEALHLQDDKHFIFVKSGSSLLKKQIQVSMMNDNEAAISNGLNKDDKVFVSIPEDTAGIEVLYLKPL